MSHLCFAEWVDTVGIYGGWASGLNLFFYFGAELKGHGIRGMDDILILQGTDV